MDGVAPERRLTGAECRLRLDEPRHPAEAGPELVRRVAGDELPPLVVVLARQQVGERDIRVAVQRVTVHERQLRALGDRVDELGRARVRDVEAIEKRELLQKDRTLAPRRRLAHGVSRVVVGGGLLEGRAPPGQVVAGEETAVLGAEAVDLGRDEPA